MPVVHRTYARALYEAATDKGRLDVVREELADFVQAVREVPELRAALRNPQLDPRAKAAAHAWMLLRILPAPSDLNGFDHIARYDTRVSPERTIERIETARERSQRMRSTNIIHLK